MKTLRWLLAAGAVLGCHAGAQAAPTIKYETTALGGDLWRYVYTLEGEAPAGGFDGLTIYFALASFDTLSNAVAPMDWDPLIAQPDAGLAADGFLDLLHLGGPLTGMVGPVSFGVDVRYLGAGAPGAQRFELYNNAPFSVVFAGQTQSLLAVPEPASVALVALALVLAAGAPALRQRR